MSDEVEGVWSEQEGTQPGIGTGGHSVHVSSGLGRYVSTGELPPGTMLPDSFFHGRGFYDDTGRTL